MSDWQPIESAPKDGEPVDLWGNWPEGNEWRRTADAHWTGSCWSLGQYTEHQFKYPPTFTHWMRVPPPAASANPVETYCPWCSEAILPGQPTAMSDGERMHIGCAAEDMDNASFDRDFGG